MAKEYLDKDGLLYFWQKIKNTFALSGHNHDASYISDVSYNSTSKKIQKTKNGSTSDVVTLATVATSGSYNDLSNKPNIPAGVVVDSALSSSSENPVQNKVIYSALGDKVDKVNGKGLSTNDYDATAKGKVDKLVFNGNEIDSSILPSYVDDVIEAYARSGQTALSSTWLATGSASGTVITPETGKIYVLMADSGDYAANTQFRWGGSAYVKLADGGVTSITNAEIDTIVAS